MRNCNEECTPLCKEELNEILEDYTPKNDTDEIKEDVDTLKENYNTLSTTVGENSQAIGNLSLEKLNKQYQAQEAGKALIIGNDGIARPTAIPGGVEILYESTTITQGGSNSYVADISKPNYTIVGILCVMFRSPNANFQSAGFRLDSSGNFTAYINNIANAQGVDVTACYLKNS